MRFSAASRLLVIQVEPWRYEKLAPLFARHLGGTSMTTAGQRSVALRLLEAVMADSHIAAVLVPGLIMEMIARAAMVQRSACAGSPLVPPFVMEAMSFIEEHLSEPITLRRVSQCLGVGQGTLARSFRASTGEYLNAHILRTRTERALHLIATTDQSLKEISAHVGFFDQSHMTNQIKRVTGLTPSQHRSTRTAHPGQSPIDTARG